MWYRLSADLVLVVHVGFVLFVLFGGFLMFRWPRLMWLHLPAVIWGAFVEFSGSVCPLTPLENWLRAQAGNTTYTGDFIIRYLTVILYPEGLTHDLQIFFGAMVLVMNLAVYGWLRLTCQRRHSQ